MPLRWLAALAFLATFAGCLDDAPATDDPADEPTVQEASAPACTPADTNNYGTNVQDLYQDGTEVWRETNGVTNLQKTETCEGPADTRVA